MQYIRYENCGSPEGVRQEIARLAEENYLSQQQAAMVDCEQIAAFFRQDIGRRLCSGAKCLREFKFSLLDDGRNYLPELSGEQVLLQGVVDCAIVDEDGIIILDFKTDRVTSRTAADAAERYRIQIETYADALSRIYELPVKAKYLYFFNINTLWEV
jgi:ATP-dependent helicase/nuclease subunit A